MKPKKLGEKFHLNKKTISHLNSLELDRARGGITYKCPTDILICDTYQQCTFTWDDFCTEGYAC